MKTLVDTNILLRMAQPAVPAASVALTAINRLGSEGYQFNIVPQVLYEYWVVCTRPTDQNGLAFQTSHVSRDIARLQKLFALLRDERAIFENWYSIVNDNRVRGKRAHDARLVAAMERHQLTHILTFNVKDFERYDSVNVIDPRL